MSRRTKMLGALLGLALLGTLSPSRADACGGRRARGCGGCGHRGRMAGGCNSMYYTYGGAGGPISHGYYDAPAYPYGGQPMRAPMASNQYGPPPAPMPYGAPPAPVPATDGTMQGRAW